MGVVGSGLRLWLPIDPEADLRYYHYIALALAVFVMVSGAAFSGRWTVGIWTRFA
jgi:hypothetical protein